MPKEKYQGEPGTEEQLKEFAVEVTWQMRGKIRVRAKNLADACEMTHFLPLPRGEYVDESFESHKNGDDTEFERYCEANELPSVDLETGKPIGQ